MKFGNLLNYFAIFTAVYSKRNVEKHTEKTFEKVDVTKRANLKAGTPSSNRHGVKDAAAAVAAAAAAAAAAVAAAIGTDPVLVKRANLKSGTPPPNQHGAKDAVAVVADPVLVKRAGGVKPPAPPAPPKKCGTSFCDIEMSILNANNGVWHIPNINSLPATSWSTNTVGSGEMVTINLGTSRVKYGGFCAAAQKSLFFLGGFVPAAIPEPSWIVTLKATDIDAAKNFIGGFSYKIDVTLADITSINSAATFCKTTCTGTTGCKYATYGWEAPGGWFCKIYGSGVCTDSTQMWWKPAPPALSVTTLGGAVPPNAIIGGGCRITDTIPITTPLLNLNSNKISPTTPYTVTLPYLTAPVTGTVVGSIKCDVAVGGITVGWPTFGTIWV